MISPRAAARVVEGNLRVWRTTAGTSAVVLLVEPLLYLGALGLGLGRLTGGEGFDDVGYARYLAPGLIAATAMQIAVQDSSWPLRGRLRTTRTLHAVTAAPVDVPDVLAGHLASVALRVAASAVAFAVVAAALGAASLPGGLLVVLPAVLTALAFAGPVVRLAALAGSDIDLAAAYRFLVIPTFALAGTFFPIERMPGALAWVAAATPLWHGGELARSAMAGIAPRWPAAVHVGYLLAWAAVGWWLARDALDRELHR